MRFLNEITLEVSDNMIRECTRHGYYSDDDLCPACNDEGKFILRSRERDSLARRLSVDFEACAREIRSRNGYQWMGRRKRYNQSISRNKTKEDTIGSGLITLGLFQKLMAKDAMK